MDFRIRKLLPSRRVKAPSSELDLQSVPYQTAATSGRLPVFIHEPLRKSRTESLKGRDSLALQSFSYDSAAPGKPPVFGGRPHKGNGPVKLQTGRRLSSGEILVTSPDDQRTLEDVREGEYIVAARAGRESRVPEPRSPSLGINPASAVYGGPASSSPKSKTHFGSPVWPASPLSTSFVNSAGPLSALASTSISPDGREKGLPLTQSGYQTPSRSSQTALGPDGLGISQRPSSPSHGAKSSAASLLEPHEEQNATIQALWKAEYSRLVTLYGQAGVDRNIAELSRDHGKLASSSTRTSHVDTSTMLFDPLPKPSLDLRDGSTTQRSSRTFYGEYAHHDSDESSQKCLSIMSSTARSSSYTTRTSVAETDSVTRREDLRKIVDDMRSTYLRAIESRGPPLQTRKTTKKKRRRKSSNVSAPAEGIPATQSTPEKQQEPQSSQSTTSSPALHSQRSFKTTSRPATGKAKLPAIQASPSKGERDADVGLKRADSTTLGSMIGEGKQATKQKRRSQITSSDPFNQTPRSSMRYSKNGKQSFGDILTHQDSSKAPNAEDFDLIYKDLFGSHGSSFWQSQPLEAPTVGLPPIPPTTQAPAPPNVTSNVTKPTFPLAV